MKDVPVLEANHPRRGSLGGGALSFGNRFVGNEGFGGSRFIFGRSGGGKGQAETEAHGAETRSHEVQIQE